MMMAKHVELDTTTHVAGVHVVVSGRHIQRCCICGEKLMDSKDRNLQTEWSEGEVVKAVGGGLRRTGREMVGIKRLPIDLCIELVEL